jgi:hypothetical protein
MTKKTFQRNIQKQDSGRQSVVLATNVIAVVRPLRGPLQCVEYEEVS